MAKKVSRRFKAYPHVAAGFNYAQDVVVGKVPACKWVKLACKRQLDDLERDGSRWPYRFDPEKAERVCRFIELLPHTKGTWASKRERIKLEPWQAFCRTVVFGWVRKKDGTRRFRESYQEVPRKNGKSLDAATVGLFMLSADDEFGAEVYSGATTEKQAWEVFRPARLMALRTPEFMEAYGIDVNASNLSRIEDGSRFEPLIGKPGDGSSPSCAIVDEFHEHDSPELYDTMMTGMGARDQPLMYIITSAGVNVAGPCYDRHLYAIKVLEGTLKDDELFAIIYTIDVEAYEFNGVQYPADDWTSEEALQKANPNFGVSVKADYLLSRQRKAMQLASQQNIFKTKHLGIWVGARNAWMNMIAWAKCPPRKPLSELAGRSCYVALDLASKVDVAVLVILFPPYDDDPLWHLHGRYYLPEDVVEEKATANHSHYATWANQELMTLTPGNVIDYEYIMDDIRDFLSRFEVIEIPYDPWQAAQLATQMLSEGATMVEYRPTVQNMSEPMKQMEALVLSKLLAHGNCPVMTWMVSNVVAKLDKKDNIYPTKEKPENKIDGPVATITAIGRAIVHQDTNMGSDYELMIV